MKMVIIIPLYDESDDVSSKKKNEKEEFCIKKVISMTRAGKK